MTVGTDWVISQMIKAPTDHVSDVGKLTLRLWRSGDENPGVAPAVSGSPTRLQDSKSSKRTCPLTSTTTLFGDRSPCTRPRRSRHPSALMRSFAIKYTLSGLSSSISSVSGRPLTNSPTSHVLRPSGITANTVGIAGCATSTRARKLRRVFSDAASL